MAWRSSGNDRRIWVILSPEGKPKGGEPMYVELIVSGGGVAPRSLHCIGTGHLPVWIGNCYSGYVPWAGECKFGFQT